MSELKKMGFEELFNSTTMFYVNEQYEQAIEAEVQKKVDELYNELREIDTKEGLKKYIVDNKDSLDNLTSLMEISTERFKRMVSMIRKDRGFVFSTEWGLGKIRTAMIESPAMMESVINLLFCGRDELGHRGERPDGLSAVRFLHQDRAGCDGAGVYHLRDGQLHGGEHLLRRGRGAV